MNIRFYIFPLILIMGFSQCSPEQTSESSRSSKEEPGMVYIPGGKFKMGGKSEQAGEDEFPVHEVEISSFWMDETEVTNRQFTKFVEETGYVTIAEKDVDWEEMKAQLPEGTP